MLYDHPVRRNACVVLICAVCCLAHLSFATANPNPSLLITEVSLRAPEYLEIYNPSDEVVSLQEFFFSYYPATRVSWEDPWRFRSFPKGATIEPHAYYLITLGDSAEIQISADWNAYSSMMLNASGGAVAILDQAPGRGDIIDAVGWGSSFLAYGNAAKVPPEGQSLQRRHGDTMGEPFRDCGDNASDFGRAPLNPANSRTGAVLVTSGTFLANLEAEALDILLLNASSSGQRLTLSTQSEMGVTAECQPASLDLASGEWGSVQLSSQPSCYYVVDLETSGYDPATCSIIEAAWARVCDGQVVQTESSLVYLQEALDPRITQLTGITTDMLASAPGRELVMAALLDDVAGTSVLSYSGNAFDRRFIEATAANLGLQMPLIEWIDGLAWARSAFPDLVSHSLEAVASFLKIDQTHHRALSDALMANQVFQEAVSRLGSSLYVTVWAEDEMLPLAALVLRLDPSW